MLHTEPFCVCFSFCMSANRMEKDPWEGMDTSFCSEDIYVYWCRCLYIGNISGGDVLWVFDKGGFYGFLWDLFGSFSFQFWDQDTVVLFVYKVPPLDNHRILLLTGRDLKRPLYSNLFQAESAQVSLLRVVPRRKISEDCRHSPCRCYLYLYCPHGKKHFPFSTAPLFSIYSCWTWENKRQRACHGLDDLLVGAYGLLLKSSLLPDLSQGATWLLRTGSPLLNSLQHMDILLVQRAPNCKE